MYYDARADDARLTLALARTAAFHGATVLNGAKVTEVTRTGGKVSGVVAEVDGREIRGIRRRRRHRDRRVAARLDRRGPKDVDAPNIRPAKGVHIAVPWMKIRNDCTVTIPVPGRNRRATITRWGDTAYLGTTDEDYHGDLDDVNCTREEMDFLLEGARTALNIDIERGGGRRQHRRLPAAGGAARRQDHRSQAQPRDPHGP